ncbi:MAG: PilN domain-containing protein [Thermodesulfobacteriota bacterium]
MIRINLLPVRAAKKKESVRIQLTIAGLSVVFIAAASFLFYNSYVNDVKAVENEIENVESELRILKSKVGELTKLRGQKRVLEDKLKVVKQLEAARSGPVDMFTAISKSIPKKAWISKFHSGNGKIKIDGLAAYSDVLAEFMRGLERNGFGPVELVVAKRAKKVKEDGRETVSFTLNLSEHKKK